MIGVNGSSSVDLFPGGSCCHQHTEKPAEKKMGPTSPLRLPGLQEHRRPVSTAFSLRHQPHAIVAGGGVGGGDAQAEGRWRTTQPGIVYPGVNATLLLCRRPGPRPRSHTHGSEISMRYNFRDCVAFRSMVVTWFPLVTGPANLSKGNQISPARSVLNSSV